MSGSYYNASGSVKEWRFQPGDLVRFAPSRKVWDYTDPYGYPVYTPHYSSRRTEVGALGIIVERYKKYGYHSHLYYRVKWSDSLSFSNERHEDLVLISSAHTQEPDIE